MAVGGAAGGQSVLISASIVPVSRSATVLRPVIHPPHSPGLTTSVRPVLLTTASCVWP